MDGNYFKVEYFYHWPCTAFCQNLFSLENPWLLGFHCFSLFKVWLPIVRSQRKAKDKKLMKIVSSWIFLLQSMRHFLSKFSFPSKTLGYLASIVSYYSTFSFPLVSHCRKPMRSQGSKIDENCFKVEYFYYWASATFCQNVVPLPKPLATWLPLFSIVQPLASPWLPIAGSQREAKDLKLIKIISKLNSCTIEHVPLSVKN